MLLVPVFQPHLLLQTVWHQTVLFCQLIHAKLFHTCYTCIVYSFKHVIHLYAIYLYYMCETCITGDLHMYYRCNTQKNITHVLSHVTHLLVSCAIYLMCCVAMMRTTYSLVHNATTPTLRLVPSPVHLYLPSGRRLQTRRGTSAEATSPSVIISPFYCDSSCNQTSVLPKAHKEFCYYNPLYLISHHGHWPAWRYGQPS